MVYGPAGLDFSAIKFGETNRIKENDSNPSADRRRTDTTTTIRLSSERAFAKDTLENRNTFNGYVINARMVTVPLMENPTQMAQLKAKVPYEAENDNAAGAASWLYKVYIPELSPLQPPKSATDPVIQYYPDITLWTGNIASGSPDLPYGTQVVVRFADLGNMAGGTIEAIAHMGTPMAQADPCGQGLQAAYSNGLSATLGSRTNGGSPIIETNPGVERVIKTSGGVNWGGNRKLQEMLEALNLAAEKEGVYLASASAARGGYDQARIMRDNYFKNGGANGGREYLTRLYKNSGPKYADILEMNLTPEAKIRKAVDEIPYMSNNNHSSGLSLDIRWGFSDNGRTPTANTKPPTKVTKVITHALKIYPIDVLMEGDHYHLTALGFEGKSTVRFFISKSDPRAKKAIADGILTYGVTNTPTSE